MRSILTAMTTAVALCGFAVQETYSATNDASYFCTAELGGGIAYNVQTKQWFSTTFKPDKGFVLHMRYLADAQDGKRYRLTVIQRGATTAIPCNDPRPDTKPGEVMINSMDEFSCWSAFGYYEFNLVKNRFLNFYPYGFVDGQDQEGNTPSVSAGTCTLIEQH